MRAAVSGAAGLALVTCFAFGVAADEDFVKARQTLMKQNGVTTKAVAPMLKGDAPFELAKVQAALTAYIETAEKAPALFAQPGDPDRTHALPAIWTNKADFTARFAKFGSDAKTALSLINDDASFRAKFPLVLKNCGDCHELYRAKL